jgi:hypothetical protein
MLIIIIAINLLRLILIYVLLAILLINSVVIANIPMVQDALLVLMDTINIKIWQVIYLYVNHVQVLSQVVNFALNRTNVFSAKPSTEI